MKYPNIQYKVLDKNPVLLGIDEGAKIIQQNDIFLEDVLEIGEKEITSNQRRYLVKRLN